MRKLVRGLMAITCSIGVLLSTALAHNITKQSTWDANNNFSITETNPHNPRWSATQNNPFPLNINISGAICFSPGGQCTQHVVDMIKKAQHSIRVQAFSFTSRPIANALVAAYRRGIDVIVILDKSNPCEARHRPATCGKNHRISNTQITKLTQADVPIYIDYVMNIAHNKVIIIDDDITLTGSFNFTYAAEKYNAENIIFIHSKEVAAAYINNFNYRLNNSATLDDYYCDFLHSCGSKVDK